MTRIYDFKAKLNNGSEVSLDQYQGKALLIVNTASKCGFTPQYQGLQTLQNEMDEKVQVLGFPCNQFGAQEPGTANEIAEFCELNYGVSFPLFQKVDVNGDQAHPLFEYLKEKLPGLMGSRIIKWNFTKFLIDQNGTPVKRFAPKDTPEKIKKFIQKNLSS